MARIYGLDTRTECCPKDSKMYSSFCQDDSHLALDLLGGNITKLVVVRDAYNDDVGSGCGGTLFSG